MLEKAEIWQHVRLAGALADKVGYDDPEALAQLRIIVGLYQDAEAKAGRLLHLPVADRDGLDVRPGYSWREIGAAQRITSAAARKRYLAG